MRRAIRVLPRGSFGPAETTITLAAAERHRRRIRLTDDSGRDFLLDLPNAVFMKDGEGLALDSGGIIRVVAIDEDVADLHGADAAHMLSVAWHIGNRHVPVQVLEDGGLRVPLDHPLLAMAERLGIRVTRTRAPFQPEPGAFDPHGLMAAPAPVVRRA